LNPFDEMDSAFGAMRRSVQEIMGVAARPAAGAALAFSDGPHRVGLHAGCWPGFKRDETDLRIDDGDLVLAVDNERRID
jgi:hypothetical protein